VHGSAACEHPWPASCRAEAACFGDKDDKENVSPLRPASAPVLARRRALAELPTSEVLARDGVGSPPATADDVQLRLPDIQAWTLLALSFMPTPAKGRCTGVPRKYLRAGAGACT
jgi:hypothetical protein